MHAVGIVAAAGSGLRLGADRPKALVPLAGRPLVCWAVDALRAGGVTDVVVAVPAAERAAFAAVLPADVRRRRRRRDPHRLGPGRRSPAAGDAADVVLVHDAARPLTPPDVVARVLAALAAGARGRRPGAARRRHHRRGGRRRRDHRRRAARAAAPGADPAGLRPRHARRRLRGARPAPRRPSFTDDAAVVRAAGVPVATVAGDERAAKITVAHDLALAELQVRAREAP